MRTADTRSVPGASHRRFGRLQERFTDYEKMAENRKRKEQADAMYKKYVKFPYESARLDTVIKEGGSFVYYYKQKLPATENTKKIDLTLDGLILSKDETRTGNCPRLTR